MSANDDIYKERALLAERRATEAILEAAKYRELWCAAASLIADSHKKLKPRGADENKIIEIARNSDHGKFWSGKTSGWL